MRSSANQPATEDWDHKLWKKIVALYELDLAEPQFSREVMHELERTKIKKQEIKLKLDGTKIQNKIHEETISACKRNKRSIKSF